MSEKREPVTPQSYVRGFVGGVVGAVLVLLAVRFVGLLAFINANAGLAAWIQGFGSLAIILATLSVARRSEKRAESDRTAAVARNEASRRTAAIETRSSAQQVAQAATAEMDRLARWALDKNIRDNFFPIETQLSKIIIYEKLLTAFAERNNIDGETTVFIARILTQMMYYKQYLKLFPELERMTDELWVERAGALQRLANDAQNLIANYHPIVKQS